MKQTQSESEFSTLILFCTLITIVLPAHKKQNKVILTIIYMKVALKVMPSIMGTTKMVGVGDIATEVELSHQ